MGDKTATTLSNAHIIKHATDIGFDVARICAAHRQEGLDPGLKAFLDRNYHGEMEWLKDRAEQRSAPQNLWPDAKSVIMLGMNYGPTSNPLGALDKKSNGVISVYAQHRDYHDIVKKRLKKLARWLIENHGGDVKVFVDTAPVLEKPLAMKAGIGWQGKHTNLVSRDFGSWLFLGSVFTTLDLTPDVSEQDHCGSCHQCIDICPTHAFPEPYKLDARKCISYLTIEHKGPIPVKYRKAMGNRIYGCDDCLAVCPWNKFAVNAAEAAFHPRQDLKAPLLKQLAVLDDGEFRKLFSGSPVKRIGRDRFIRNVLIAMGNSNDDGHLPTIKTLLTDPSPVVRGTACWAFQQIAPDRDVQKHRDRIHATEKDETVLDEWR